MKSRKLIALFCMAAALILTAGTGKKAMAAEVTTETVTEAATDTEATTETAAETTTECTTESEDAEVKAEADKVEKVEKEEKKETKKNSYTKKELRLMAAIIFCEAGNESYKGKMAVASVIMNRVESKKFPNTVKGVIYQKGQFSPARTGKLARELANYDAGRFTSKNHRECIKAAKAALSGENTMPGYLYFNGYSKSMARRHPNGIRIQNQWFHKTF